MLIYYLVRVGIWLPLGQPKNIIWYPYGFGFTCGAEYIYVLHKIFNHNTVKISYSCMSNLKQNIDGHNKSTLQKKIVPSKTCNCRKAADCPLAGHCLKQSVGYQATVTT